MQSVSVLQLKITSFLIVVCSRMQNRLRISELKHEMANIHANKLQSQLKSFIKVSRWVAVAAIQRLSLLNFFCSLQTYIFSHDFFMLCEYFWHSNALLLLHSSIHFFIARPYYETRANYNAKLRNLKTRIMDMEAEVQTAKAAYNEALQNLEKISDEIHKLREDQKLVNDFHEEVIYISVSTIESQIYFSTVSGTCATWTIRKKVISVLSEQFVWWLWACRWWRRADAKRAGETRQISWRVVRDSIKFNDRIKQHNVEFFATFRWRSKQWSIRVEWEGFEGRWEETIGHRLQWLDIKVFVQATEPWRRLRTKQSFRQEQYLRTIDGTSQLRVRSWDHIDLKQERIFPIQSTRGLDRQSDRELVPTSRTSLSRPQSKWAVKSLNSNFKALE